MFVGQNDCLKNPAGVFKYYTIERERIRYKKEILTMPTHKLTQDPVLSEWKFCNIFREDDKVTRHYLAWIEPLRKQIALHKDPFTTAPELLLALVASTQMYRTLNWPPTLNKIGRMGEFLDHETKQRAIQIELDMFKAGEKTCTGAYLLPQCGRKGDRKIVVVMDSVEQIYRFRNHWMPVLQENSLQKMWLWLRNNVAMDGPFISYEIVTDLSYNILKNARDIMTWANAGPGALRGINRYKMKDKKAHLKQDTALTEMVFIMYDMQKWFDEEARSTNDKMWSKVCAQNAKRVNMRTAEHTLCEFDKYCRVILGQGTPRARYTPTFGEFDVK